MSGSFDEEAERRYRAPALDKGLDILERLATIEEGLTQIELAKSLNRSPNEIYRMLDRLVRRGYVLRSLTDRYTLSLKLFALGHQHPPLRRLVAQAVPVMRRFAEDAGQACHLAVYQRGLVAVVAQVDAPSYWSLALRAGAQLDPLESASGHVLLAFQAASVRASMLAECAAAPPGLEVRLDMICERGHAVRDSPEQRGVTMLAAPVLGTDGGAAAALACPYVAPRAGGASQERVVALLWAAGASLSLAPRNACSATAATASARSA